MVTGASRLIVVSHMDWMAEIKAVLPLAVVLSGEAPQERREETVSSDADTAADISGDVPFLVFGCKKTVMMMMIHIDNYHVDSHDNENEMMRMMIC